jgi:hypothetical protein
MPREQLDEVKTERGRDGMEAGQRGIRRLRALDRGVGADGEASLVRYILLAPRRREAEMPRVFGHQLEKDAELHPSRRRREGSSNQVVYFLYSVAFRTASRFHRTMSMEGRR